MLLFHSVGPAIRRCFSPLWECTSVRLGCKWCKPSPFSVLCRIQPPWDPRKVASPSMAGCVKATWTVPSASPWGWETQRRLCNPHQQQTFEFLHSESFDVSENDGKYVFLVPALCFSPSKGGISTWPSLGTAPIIWTSTKTRKSPKSPKEPFSWTPAWVWFRYVLVLCSCRPRLPEIPQCQTGCPAWCCGSPGCGLVPCGN